MDLRTLRGSIGLDTSAPLPLDRPFTTALANEEGVSVHQLSWLVRRGFLWHPVKGVYLATQVPASTAVRCQALSLVVPEDCVVVDRHAGWLHGAEMVLAPNEHLHLKPVCMYRPSGRGRLRNDLADSGERNLRPHEVVELNGLRVSTPLRTAWDLGRVRWPDTAISGLDAMLRLGFFTRGELLDGIERFRGMRWVRTLRLMAPLADGRAASPGESVLRLRWIEAHLPEVHPQLEVWLDDILLGILDLGSEELRYAAEYDGAEWHTSEAQRAHDLARRLAISDEAWLIDAFVAADLYGPHANAEARLRQGADAARRRRRPAAS